MSEKLRRNLTLTIPLPEGLLPEMTGFSVVGFLPSEKVSVIRHSNSISLEFPESQENRALAVNVAGKNAEGQTISKTFLLTYSSLNGWQQIDESIAQAWQV